MQYIGESERSIQERFSGHKAYVANKQLSKATGAHLNLPGHSVSEMKVSIFEKVHSLDPLVRKEREDFLLGNLTQSIKALTRGDLAIQSFL